MERLTYVSDGYYAVDNENCYDDQNEDYCGPAIDLLAGYEDTGLLPEELKAKLDRLDILEKAMERLGSFGRLFVDYKGCPRGRRGYRGENFCVPGIPNKHILLEEDPIIDVEGDVWIPVLARDLYWYINRDLWVPVTERLPENGYPVLVTCGKGHRPIIARYSSACNAWRVPHALRITHWMPLPELPKEDE